VAEPFINSRYLGLCTSNLHEAVAVLDAASARGRLAIIWWQGRQAAAACVRESVASWMALVNSDGVVSGRLCGERSSQWIIQHGVCTFGEGVWETNGRQMVGSKE
jgi:hypothetical protein